MYCFAFQGMFPCNGTKMNSSLEGIVQRLVNSGKYCRKNCDCLLLQTACSIFSSFLLFCISRGSDQTNTISDIVKHCDEAWPQKSQNFSKKLKESLGGRDKMLEYAPFLSLSFSSCVSAPWHAVSEGVLKGGPVNER